MLLILHNTYSLTQRAQLLSGDEQLKAKIAAGLLILVILLAGCATQNPQGNAQANDKLRMGMVVYVGEGPYFVADEKGFFADEGVDVEFVSFSDPAVLKSAFAGNQLDGYFFTADAIAFDASSGLEGKIFWVPSSSDGADGIIAGTAIQSVQDLNGKKIAFLEGSPSHFFLAQILKANDMTFQDIQTVNLDPDKAAEAFFAGNVDGAVTSYPFSSKRSAKYDPS
jgi:NitT/TauT family transport system substrate-binding protein